MKKLLDFSAARPSGASIKKVADGVIRYLSSSSWKNLTASEVKDYLANGLEIGVIWETTANRCLSGFPGGKADATEALKQLKSLLPSVIPIYFAVDFNITENQLTTLDEYLNGAESVLGKDYVGVYGSYSVIEHCFAKNSAKWFWQTLAWSNKKISAHNHIYQDGKTPPIKDTDTNVAVDDWGYKPITSEPVGALPSTLLDLKNWKLTLPIGSPTEILQPALDKFTDPKFFYVNTGKAGVVFTAPVNGKTTSGSGYPRSELREMNGKELASWDTTKGKHNLKISQAVLALPKKKKHIVVGQIHDKDDDIIVIRLEDKKLFVDVGGTNAKVLADNYQLGEIFGIEFVVENGKIKVYYNGVLAHTLEKSVSVCYFKAGAYTQSNCSKEDICSEENFGSVIIYYLKVTHTESNGTIPAPTPATKGKVISRKQGDPRWGSVKIGQSNSTLAGYGCLLTVISDALYWMGIDLLPDYLAKNLSFTPEGLLYWNSITEKTRAKFVYRYYSYNIGVIENALKHPTQCVFLEFKLGTGKHWAWALSKDWAGRYRIADPLTGTFELHTKYGTPTGMSVIDIQ